MPVKYNKKSGMLRRSKRTAYAGQANGYWKTKGLADKKKKGQKKVKVKKLTAREIEAEKLRQLEEYGNKIAKERQQNVSESK